MRTNRSFEELRDHAVALRRAGKPRREIRETLGIHGGLLGELLKGEPMMPGATRPGAKDDLRARARELRTEGMSYKEIAAELGVSKGSCSLWLRDMATPERLSPERRRERMVLAQQARRRSERPLRDVGRAAVKLAAAREIGELSDRDLLLAGALSYWCEGAKAKPHRREKRVTFCNSDPALIMLFLRFLDLVGIERDRLRFQLQVHETADSDEIQRFWLEVCGARADQFCKPTFKKVNPKTNRRNIGVGYRGCLRVDVSKSAELYTRIERITRAILDGKCPNSPVTISVSELRRLAVTLRQKGRTRSEIKDVLGVDTDMAVDELLKGEPQSAVWLEGASTLDVLEDQARGLRANGWGRRRIADELGVPRTLVAKWIPPLTEQQMPPSWEPVRRRAAGLQHYWDGIQAGAAIARHELVEAVAGEVGELDSRELRLLGAVMYWCEGAKDKHYRRAEQVSFINRDPELVKFFLAFLDAVGIDRSRIRVRIHIHETGDLDSAVHFWSQVTGHEPGSFLKPILKRHVPKTQYRSEIQAEYYGCVQIEVRRGSELYRQIEGWALGAMLGEVEAQKRWTEVHQCQADL